MKSYLNQSLVQFIWPPSHVHPAGTPTALSLFPDCTSPAPGEEALASRCTDGCSMGAAGLPRVALWSLFSKSPKSQRLLSSSEKPFYKRPPPPAQPMLLAAAPAAWQHPGWLVGTCGKDSGPFCHGLEQLRIWPVNPGIFLHAFKTSSWEPHGGVLCTSDANPLPGLSPATAALHPPLPEEKLSSL